MLSDEQIKTIELKAINSFRSKLDARQIYPIKHVPDLWMAPVIHKEVTYNEETLDKAIEEMTDAVATAENKLLFTGEYEGWTALGIKGLSTVEGRFILPSSGKWPENTIEDILDAKKQLSGMPVLIVPTNIGLQLEEPFWEDPEHEKPPLSYRNYLVEQGIVQGIIVTPHLFTYNGGQDSALLVIPGEENFYAIQEFPLEVHVWFAEDKVSMTLRETIIPIIKNPKSIVEITHIFL